MTITNFKQNVIASEGGFAARVYNTVTIINFKQNIIASEGGFAAMKSLVS